MAFVFRKDPTFDWPVTVREPQDGRKVAASIGATFRVLPVERVAALVEAARKAPVPGDAELAILREVLIGWTDVLDEDKAPVPFTDVARDAVLAVPYVRAAFLEAYLEAVGGAARRGKLIQAARHWAAGDDGGELAEARAALGIPSDDDDDDGSFAVWPENRETFTVFIALATQWRYAGGVPVGIDYAAVRPVARLLGVAMTVEILSEVQAMEAAALVQFARMQEARRGN